MEAAVVEIQKQRAQGADFIKVIDVDSDVFYAALEESKRLDLPFLGHLQPSINVTQAARASMRSIEHLGPRDAVLLGCSSDEEALRRDTAHRPPRAVPAGGPGPMSAVVRGTASPLMFTDPSEFPRYQRVVDTFSADRCRELASHFVACGTWQVPTLIRLRTMAFVDDREYRTDPNLSCIPATTREMWEELAELFPQRIPVATRETFAQLFALQMKLIKPFKDAGVKMMAGSDSGASAAWCLPGFGLHREFDLLEQAGLTPLDILQMTTLNGAEFLGREATMGSVQQGKDANLVLLEANPMDSAQNLHRVSAVIRGGAYLSAEALNAMKQRPAV